MRRLAVILLVLGMTAAPAAAQEYVDASKRFVQDLADRAIAAATADLPAERARVEVRALLTEGFAVRGIARFILGRYWRTASDDERTEYLQLFEDVVIDISATRLQSYAGQKFEITTATPAASANPREQTAIVASRFHLTADSIVRIDWRVASLGDTYKITDVIVEGVSLATTYRDEFTSIVRRQGIPGLLVELRQQRAELAAPQTNPQ